MTTTADHLVDVDCIDLTQDDDQVEDDGNAPPVVAPSPPTTKDSPQLHNFGRVSRAAEEKPHSPFARKREEESSEGSFFDVFEYNEEEAEELERKRKRKRKRKMRKPAACRGGDSEADLLVHTKNNTSDDARAADDAEKHYPSTPLPPPAPSRVGRETSPSSVKKQKTTRAEVARSLEGNHDSGEEPLGYPKAGPVAEKTPPSPPSPPQPPQPPSPPRTTPAAPVPGRVVWAKARVRTLNQRRRGGAPQEKKKKNQKKPKKNQRSKSVTIYWLAS